LENGTPSDATNATFTRPSFRDNPNPATLEDAPGKVKVWAVPRLGNAVSRLPGQQQSRIQSLSRLRGEGIASTVHAL